MSVRVKNISAKHSKPDSGNVEEFLVERYESLISKFNLFESIGRWIYIGILFTGIILVFNYRNNEIPIFYFFVPCFIAIIAFFILNVGIMSRQFKLQKKIFHLEQEIIKVQMEKEFQNDENLKDKFEDFYIRFFPLRRKIQDSSVLIFIEVGIYSLLYFITVITIKGISN